MGFIYQESNAYGVEALVALERHYTPTEEKYCTAVTEAVRICDTYGIPERDSVITIPGIFYNLSAVTLGNLVGGFMVALVYWWAFAEKKA